MVDREFIQAVLEELSEEFHLPVPKFIIQDVPVSFYRHSDETIILDKSALDDFKGDQVALAALAIHEWRHFYQDQVDYKQGSEQRGAREREAVEFVQERLESSPIMMGKGVDFGMVLVRLPSGKEIWYPIWLLHRYPELFAQMEIIEEKEREGR